MSRPTKTPEASPTASITPEALKALFDNMNELRATVAKYEAEAKAVTSAMNNGKISMAGKSEQSIKNEIAAVRAFKKLGITAKPNLDTFTFNRWISKGMRPKEGSKSVRVANLRLFHVSQCRKLTADELAAQTEQPKAAEARKGKGPKVVPIHGEVNPPQ